MPSPLKNKKKIELLFRLGEKRGSEVFECRCLSSSENEGETRFVVVAPKKNFPRAVDRNKIKRRIKNIMLYVAQNVKINSEYSYLIIAKKNVFNDRFEDIKTELFLNFKKIK